MRSNDVYFWCVRVIFRTKCNLTPWAQNYANWSSNFEPRPKIPESNWTDHIRLKTGQNIVFLTRPYWLRRVSAESFELQSLWSFFLYRNLQKIGRERRSFFLNFRPKVPRRIPKKNFEEKSIISGFQNFFGVLPVGNLKSGSSVYLKFYVYSDAKWFRTLAAIPKCRPYKNTRVKKNWPLCGFLRFHYLQTTPNHATAYYGKQKPNHAKPLPFDYCKTKPRQTAFCGLAWFLCGLNRTAVFQFRPLLLRKHMCQY